jgi:hypothetical protein
MPDGRWNLQEAAELIRRASGGKTAEGQPPTQAAGPPQLPRVTLTDGTIRVIDLAGRQATLNPLNVKGSPDGPLVWDFEVTESDRLKITGQVAPGGDWSHHAKLELKNLGPLVKPLLQHPSPSTVQALEEFKLRGTWIGRAADHFSGRLDFDDLFVAGATATGPMSVSLADGVVTLLPTGLVVTSPKRAGREVMPPARAAAGAVYVDPRSVTIKDLSLGFAGGEIRASGSYAWDRGAGKIEAWWNKLAYPAGMTHGGSLVASLSQPWPDQPVINVSVVTHGHTGNADTWNAQVDLAGKGLAWDNIDWTLKAPRLTYEQPSQAYNLDGINARLATRGRTVSLDSIDVPPGNLYGKWKRGKLDGFGKYDMTDGQWFAYVSGRGWPISPRSSTPADFQIDAYGDGAWARLKQFFMEGAGLQVTAVGDVYYRARGMPANLHLYAKAPPVEYAWRERGADPRDDVRLSGRLYSELHVTGAAATPLRLDIDGKLFAHEFKQNGRALGNVVMRISGRATDDALALQTDRLKLFGGEWDLSARYRWNDRLTDVTVVLGEISLARFDDFLRPPPNIRGTLQGRWVVRVPDFDLKQMEVDGEYTIHKLAKANAPAPTTAPTAAVASRDPRSAADLQAVQASHVRGPDSISPRTGPATRDVPVVQTSADRSYTTSPTTVPTAAVAVATTQPDDIPIADVITGKVTAADGMVAFDPIKLRRRSGIANAKLTFPITAPREAHLDLSVGGWPVDYKDVRRRPSNLLIWFDTKLDLDLKKLEASGPLKVHRAVIAKQEETVAVITADAEVQRRRIDVKSIKGEGLGGTIAGDGYVYLDTPLQSSGRIDWNDIDAEAITALMPYTEGLVGKYSGALRFSPVTPNEDRDATGPFRVTGRISAQNGALNGIQIGDATFVLYGDFHRAVLHRFEWNIAGGLLKGWARFTDYAGDKFAHLNLQFESLDLDQLIYAAKSQPKDHKAVPGRVSGQAIAAGNPFTPEGRRSASGDVTLSLTDSDLANVAFVNALYTVMSIKWDRSHPTGRGYVSARLEGPRLEVPILRYTNRGVDIWANAAVVDIFKVGDSPIEGTAAGSARPLKDLKLPFMADVDKVLAALQGGLATVAIEGTVKQPKPRVIPFAASSDTFRRFMLGEVSEATKGSAGR